jgi:hypothetical protein
MDTNRIIAELDTEIARLQQIRAAVAGIGSTAPKGKRGRPKGSTSVTTAAPAAKAKTARKKHKLSPEGRKRIVDAMKRRWATQRKKTAK